MLIMSGHERTSEVESPNQSDRGERLTVGKWWRFQTYEIQDGAIRPASGARLKEYDLWEREGASVQPLLDLVSQARSVHSGWKNIAMPSAETHGEIVKWCRRYGLLGILPHRVAEFRQVSRWKNADSRSEVLYRVREVVRSATGWASRTRTVSPESESRLPRSEVVIQDLEGFAVRMEPFSQTWATYFPDVPRKQHERYAYPVPLSGDFWQQYAEPVHEFLAAAVTLADAILRVREAGADADFNVAAKTLHALVSPVRVRLQRGTDGRVRQQWACPSLLASLAMSALLGLAQGALRFCENCGAPFVTESYQGKFCKPQCRWAYEKRLYRQRQVEESVKGA